MAYKTKYADLTPAQKRVRRAQTRVNTLVDQGVSFNPTTLNPRSLDRAAENLNRRGLAYSEDATFVSQRAMSSATAPRTTKPAPVGEAVKKHVRRNPLYNVR